MSGRSKATRRKALEFNVLALHNTTKNIRFNIWVNREVEWSEHNKKKRACDLWCFTSWWIHRDSVIHSSYVVDCCQILVSVVSPFFLKYLKKKLGSWIIELMNCRNFFHNIEWMSFRSLSAHTIPLWAKKVESRHPCGSIEIFQNDKISTQVLGKNKLNFSLAPLKNFSSTHSVKVFHHFHFLTLHEIS